jgi:hypothetical protein
LSKRLHPLVNAGVVERRPEGGEVQYLLTPAGRELEPIVMALGAWGVRWIGELGDQDLDPKLLLWTCTATSSTPLCRAGAPSSSSGSKP